MKVLIFVAIIISILIFYILLYMFLSPANKGKLICPVDNCFEAFTDEHEYLDHLQKDHREYFDTELCQYENDIW